MNKLEMTESIIAAKQTSGLGWEHIAEQVGLAPVFLTSACPRMSPPRCRCSRTRVGTSWCPPTP